MVTATRTATRTSVSDTCEVFAVNVEAVEAVRRVMKPVGTLTALAQTFSILGDPTRARLLYALSKRELCVCDLANLLGMSLSAISHQLRALRTSRIVRARREGRIVFYSLDDAHIAGLLHQGLEHVEEA